jgi:hypothetical protein
MTISVLDTKELHEGDGVTVAFPFNFKVDTVEDVIVLLTSITGVETLLTQGEDEDYTVVLNTNQNSNPGGTVTLAAAPGVQVPLVIMRGVDFIRVATFTNSVPPHVIESELDRLTMYAQQLKEKLDRSLHLSAATQEIADSNYRNVQARAGKIAGWNGTGQAALYGFEAGSIVGPAGPLAGSRVEYSAPAIVIRESNLLWTHDEVTVTFIWTADGVTVEERELVITVDTDTAQFDDPGLTEPGDEFTTTLGAAGQLLIITSEFNDQREYAQLAISTMPTDEYPTDTFTPAWGTGEFTADPTGDVTYAERVGTVSLFLEAALVAESATGALTWDAATLPAALRPSAARTVECTLQYDDTLEAVGQATFLPDGSAVFGVHEVDGAQIALDGAFQTGEDKGLPASWSAVYSI